jgi:hypothetical protein
MLTLPPSLHCSREEGHKQTSLHSDNVARGKGCHSREIQLKGSKHEEGHVALGRGEVK